MRLCFFISELVIYICYVGFLAFWITTVTVFVMNYEEGDEIENSVVFSKEFAMSATGYAVSYMVVQGLWVNLFWKFYTNLRDRTDK